MASTKHPAAKAWDQWQLSGEGQRCSAGTASGEYLRNRLWRAFMAGRASAEKRAVTRDAAVKSQSPE